MLKQTLQQKLLQKLSPQQIQLMKLLQIPLIELEQRVKQEIEDNPALEEGIDEDAQSMSEDEQDYEVDDTNDSQEDFDISDYMDDDDIPDYKLSVNNRSKDDEEKSVPISSGSTFRDLIEDQLRLRSKSERELLLGQQLIGNLDDDGYLRRELENIVDDLAFSQNIMTSVEELEEILQTIQDLDPPGIGARTLQECLLIQLNRKPRVDASIITARKVLEDYFDEFTKKHYSKIVKKLDIEDEHLKDAIEEIVKLNPKPGNSLKDSGRIVQHVIPDFLITEEDGELSLSLNGRNAPQLKVSRSYKEMLEAYASNKEDKKAKEAAVFVKNKLDSARWFIEAIKQRQETLFYTMSAIMEYQKEYFLTGDETKLKPMILKDIADIVGLDISTISRVANSKHVQTPFGNFPLKYFFSESLSTSSGEEVSTREVKKILQDAIDAEDKKKPLTDEKLAKLLKEKGYNIARRTVAKYREQLDIPVARLRKEL